MAQRRESRGPLSVELIDTAIAGRDYARRNRGPQAEVPAGDGDGHGEDAYGRRPSPRSTRMAFGASSDRRKSMKYWLLRAVS
jgi:hypothetical protein